MSFYVIEPCVSPVHAPARGLDVRRVFLVARRAIDFLVLYVGYGFFCCLSYIDPSHISIFHSVTHSKNDTNRGVARYLI